MNTVLEKIGVMKLVPAVILQKAEDASPLADALVKGGLPCAEITFRTAAAAEAINIMAKRGDLLVGAGTVLSVDQVKQAVDNGATYIVAPGFSEKVVGYCVSENITIIPGVSTATEITSALEAGLDVVKFFPADACGGLKALKALSGPFPMMKFIPTGGIDSVNMIEYLKFPKVMACGGSWMVKSDLIKEKKFDEIQRITHQAVTIAGTIKH
ncbi:MAG: bifunctional 4-hydroxy-2-oxoglutarate aldolase/2-dehydro-3-deoxy-phosphogluconate aldolase [Kiritimatiellae bacterium]|nr:bifunctional 4-hydroxy-2-oxoglutarate aldolase/2-dehydro-3-deoxy-phosphogluconate aldolase [Kiritimatiellia bacterium]MDD5519868.1 bifunctional 4-hydroxy-2-oxoglutarate aldolase/2-dehydro-3-deoxy-phosphogluconate aldolase [Kiritimatiellia bacterium]